MASKPMVTTVECICEEKSTTSVFSIKLDRQEEKERQTDKLRVKMLRSKHDTCTWMNAHLEESDWWKDFIIRFACRPSSDAGSSRQRF